MRDNKYYLDSSLTLLDLAIKLDTNRTYLSNYINDEMNTNFYDYINSFRLEYAVQMVRNNNNKYTLLGIAESSGFNCVSTFRRCFVKKYGCTPSKYLDKKI